VTGDLLDESRRVTVQVAALSLWYSRYKTNTRDMSEVKSSRKCCTVRVKMEEVQADTRTEILMQDFL
jgi:hypothetical protein